MTYINHLISICTIYRIMFWSIMTLTLTSRITGSHTEIWQTTIWCWTTCCRLWCKFKYHNKSRYDSILPENLLSSLCLKFVSPTCLKTKLKKKLYLFKQILSYFHLSESSFTWIQCFVVCCWVFYPSCAVISNFNIFFY